MTNVLIIDEDPGRIRRQIFDSNGSEAIQLPVHEPGEPEHTGKIVYFWPDRFAGQSGGNFGAGGTAAESPEADPSKRQRASIAVSLGWATLTLAEQSETLPT